MRLASAAVDALHLKSFVWLGRYRASNTFGGASDLFGRHRPPLQKNIRIVTPPCPQILGVKFFNGDTTHAVEHILHHGNSVAASGALEGDLTKWYKRAACDF
jgi:hypothetical protein